MVLISLVGLYSVVRCLILMIGIFFYVSLEITCITFTMLIIIILYTINFCHRCSCFVVRVVQINKPHVGALLLGG